MGSVMEYVNKGTPFCLIGVQVQGGERRVLASCTGALRVRGRTSEIVAVLW
jgi:hypothetical protein